MKTLILGVDYTPLSIVSMGRGITLSERDDVTVLKYYEEPAQSAGGPVRVPAVLLYSRYIKMVRAKDTPTKSKILLRDQYICQYCGIMLEGENATIDHVVPASRFKNRVDSNTWDNLVACCKKCNNKKGDKLPDAAGFTLRAKPKKPSYSHLSRRVMVKKIPKEWESFI